MNIYRSILDDDETVVNNVEESLPITIELIKEFMSKYRFYFRYDSYKFLSTFVYSDVSQSYEVHFDPVIGWMENGQINYDHDLAYSVTILSNIVESAYSIKNPIKHAVIKNLGDIKRYAAFCRDVADTYDKFLADPEYVERLLNVRIIPILFNNNDTDKYVYIHNFIYNQYYLKNERVPKHIG